MPGGLKKLDDRVLGSKGRDRSDGHDEHPRDEHGDVYPDEDGRRTETVRVRREPADAKGSGGGGDGLSSFLSVFWRISRLVLLALAAVVLLAAALILLPANEDNVIVRNVLSLAETVAGPFKDVFTVDDADRMRVYNYALAGVVYLVLASIVGKLPTGSKRAS